MTRKWCGFMPQNEAIIERWLRLESSYHLPPATPRFQIAVREGKRDETEMTRKLLGVGLHKRK